MKDLMEEVEESLRGACRLSQDRILVLGVSGGPDSMCMLDLLQNCGYPLVVAHLDHQMRPSSAVEAAAVRQEAAARGLQFIDSAVDVVGYAAAADLSLEEAARTVRYRFLFDVARQVSAQAVGVGHTADDQVETVLMHLIQGAGLKGLRGMDSRNYLYTFSEDIPVVRPILSLWRKDILAYCAEKGLHTFDDLSNRDTAFTRNRIRHTLVPLLETFNPRAREAIWRLSHVVSGELAVNQASLDPVWKLVLQEAAPGSLTFRRQVWSGLDIGYQRGLLIRAIAKLDPENGVRGFHGIEELLAFIRMPGEPRRVKQFGRMCLVCEAGVFWLLGPGMLMPEDHFPQVDPNRVLDINIPGEQHLAGGWALGARLVADLPTAYSQAQGNTDPYKAWVDVGEAGSVALTLRCRRAGDRFRPLGMGGRTQKLSDFMINEKMPRRARDLWPLVFAGNELVWVPGFRLAHPYRLTGQTKRAIFLSMQKGAGQGG